MGKRKWKQTENPKNFAIHHFSCSKALHSGREGVRTFYGYLFIIHMITVNISGENVRKMFTQKAVGRRLMEAGEKKVCCLDKNLQVSNVNLPFQWVDCYSGPEFIREENFITCLSNKLSKWNVYRRRFLKPRCMHCKPQLRGWSWFCEFYHLENCFVRLPSLWLWLNDKLETLGNNCRATFELIADLGLFNWGCSFITNPSKAS